MRDIYGTTLKVISLVVVVRGIGSIIGASLGKTISRINEKISAHFLAVSVICRSVSLHNFLQQEFIFSAGFLLDKYPNYRLFLLFGYNFVLGLTNMMLPHAKLLWLFFLTSGLASFSGGSLDAGGNVLCLEIWDGGDAGPYLHSIHFSFAIGAFLAPVLALPFLAGHSSKETILNSTQWVKSKAKSFKI
jgi:hypothetical protein